MLCVRVCVRARVCEIYEINWFLSTFSLFVI
jgi:hypothetical protein